MADEQAIPEIQAEPTATEATTQIPPETPPEPQPEVTTEATPETPAADGRPGWDKERQKKDEELALLRKRNEEQEERINRLFSLVEKQIAPVQTQPAPQTKDALDEAESLYAEAEKVAAGDADNPGDPFKAQELSAKAGRIIVQQQREAAKQRREQEESSKRDRDWESQFVRDNPTIPLDKGKEAVRQAFDYAAKLGLSGEAQRGAAQVHFAMALEALKKSPPPTSRPAQSPPRTAPAASGNAPAGPRVTPVSGARKEPVQYADAAKSITEKLLGSRR